MKGLWIPKSLCMRFTTDSNSCISVATLAYEYFESKK